MRLRPTMDLRASQHNDAGWAGLRKGIQRAHPLRCYYRSPENHSECYGWQFTANVTAIEVPPTDLRAPHQRDDAGGASLIKLARGCGACRR